MSDALTEAPVEQDQAYRFEDGDQDRFSHYARKADIERAILDGEPCVALCGKKWLPTRDPERFPVCPRCREVWEALP